MRIKRFFTAVALMAISTTAFAQSATETYSLEIPKDNMLEISGGHMLNNVFRFKTDGEMRTAKPGGGATFGITYSRKVIDWLWVGGGVNYMGLYNTYQSYASDPVVQRTCPSNIWSIPLFARFDLLKWLYLKPGFAFDIQNNNPEGRWLSNQTGMSLNLALGFDFVINKSWHIGLETRAGLTSLAAFRIREKDKYATHQRFVVYGETINLFYRF